MSTSLQGNDDLIGRTIEVTTHGRYLVAPCLASGPRPILVGYHGYAENAERMLDQMRRIPGSERWLLVSVQGLHRFYNRSEEIVASWMTRQDRELAIADNIAYVDRVLGAVRREHATTKIIVHVGFSQGVGMAFRAAADRPAEASGIIALGGDIPPDVRGRSFPPVLLARGETDTWYTTEKLEADVSALASAGGAPRTLVFAGGHEWTDEFRRAAGEFLEERLGEAGA